MQVRQNPEDDDSCRDERQETRRRHGLMWRSYWTVGSAYPNTLGLVADPSSRNAERVPDTFFRDVHRGAPTTERQRAAALT